VKILLCHNYYQQLGGEDITFADEAWLLESRGHSVLCYTIHNDEIPKLSKLNVARQTFWNSKVRKEVQELIRAERPDIMHCTNIFPLLSPSIYKAAKSEGVPIVQALHNYRLMCPNAVFSRNNAACEDCLGKIFAWPAILHGCYRNSRLASTVVSTMLAYHRLRGTWHNEIDLFFTLTEFARQKYIQGGFPAEKIDVKPNFIRKHDIDFQGERNGAIYVGRLSEEKGISTLLEAWENHDIDLKLKLVGDGPLRDSIQKAAANDSRIDWIGQLPPAQVMEEIAKAQVLVLPSNCYETFGRTIVEGYSVGTPSVASRLGAMKEGVIHGKTGMLFDPGNSVDLMAKLDAVCSHPNPEEMQNAARARFEEAFTEDINYEMMLQIYEKAIHGEAKKQVVGNSNKQKRIEQTS
jgi:glycosyltransferase involved in cell wall biosynthesis